MSTDAYLAAFAENDNYWFRRHNIPLALTRKSWIETFNAVKFNATRILYLRLKLSERKRNRESDKNEKSEIQEENRFVHTS